MKIMNHNAWILALAGVGLVSLPVVACAEEKPNALQTGVASTTLSGYVDTSAEWNPGTGNGNLPPYKFNGPAKADGFNLDVVQLRIDKPLDESDWAAGYRMDLWFGPDARVLGTSSSGVSQVFGGTASDFAIRQAYVALRAPIGTGLDFKLGVFDSIIGYESIEAGNNPNFTRSYGHSIEPQTETGLLASYRFCDCLSASVGVADTFGPIINDRAFAPVNQGNPNQTEAESYKTYMASVALTAPDSMGFLSGSTLYAGFVNGFDDAGANIAKPLTVSSYYVGATVATPVTGLRAGASFDYLDLHPLNNDDYSIAGYLSYQATEKLSFHARVEYFKDNAGVLFSPVNAARLGNTGKAEVLALTATAQYDLWKNVISRLELRWDHSLLGNDIFGGTTAGNPNANGQGQGAKNAWLLAANVIYKF
jgi:hypothetical protein